MQKKGHLSLASSLHDILAVCSKRERAPVLNVETLFTRNLQVCYTRRGGVEFCKTDTFANYFNKTADS